MHVLALGSLCGCCGAWLKQQHSCVQGVLMCLVVLWCAVYVSQGLSALCMLGCCAARMCLTPPPAAAAVETGSMQCMLCVAAIEYDFVCKNITCVWSTWSVHDENGMCYLAHSALNGKFKQWLFAQACPKLWQPQATAPCYIVYVPQ